MIKQALRGAGVAAASALAVAAVAVPAHADTRYFADRVGDTGWAGDISKVKVANSSAGNTRIGVRAQVGEYDPGDLFTFWFDTNRNNPGPEYKVAAYANSDGPQLQRLEAFGERGRAVPCRGLRATADAFGPEEVSVAVPRSCMGSPRAVGVSLRARYHDDHGQEIVDWAPSERRFYAAVTR